MSEYESQRDFALRRLPAFARNPLALPGASCTVCATPTSGYTLCYQCNTQSYLPDIADLVVPLTYAGPRNPQMQRDLFNYKGQSASVAEQAVTNLAWLV